MNISEGIVRKDAENEKVWGDFVEKIGFGE